MDPIANMLTIIRNGYMANLAAVFCKKSKVKTEIAKLLAKHGFIKSVTVDNNDLKIELAYYNKQPVITQIKRVSKPGLRVYQSIGQLRKRRSRIATKILSTPHGIMTDHEAIAKNTGGEVIAVVY